ncbi:MAG TPA: O-antigen ligase family protein [Comamonas sp.]
MVDFSKKIFEDYDQFKSQSKTDVFSAFFLIIGFLGFPVALGVGNVGILLAVILALIGGTIFRFRGMLSKEPLVWIFLFLFILAVLSISYSAADWDTGVWRTFNKYSKFLFVIPILALLSYRFVRHACLAAFSLSMFFLLLCTYLNVWFEIPWSATNNQGWFKDHTVVGDYITQNIMMSFFAVLCLHFGIHAKDKSRKIFGILIFLAACVAVTTLSPGRTGYLMLIGGLMAYLFFLLPKYWGALGALAVGGITAVAVLNSDVAMQRIDLAVQETKLIFEQKAQGEIPDVTSTGGRWQMWATTWELIQERPLLGWGLGSYGIKFCDKMPEEAWCELGDRHPHNQYLSFWVELGILGLLGFLVLMGVLFWAAWGDRQMRPLMAGFIAVLAINSVFNVSLWSSREYHFFILMMCLLYAICRFDKLKVEP